MSDAVNWAQEARWIAGVAKERIMSDSSIRLGFLGSIAGLMAAYATAPRVRDAEAQKKIAIARLTSKLNKSIAVTTVAPLSGSAAPSSSAIDASSSAIVAAATPQQEKVLTVSIKEAERRKLENVKVSVNGDFYRHFFHFLKIAFPSFRSRQGLHLGILSILLLLRTYLTIKISALTGIIAKRMVEGVAGPFLWGVATLAAWSIPASLVNSGLKYMTALLAVSFRRNLTYHFHRRYLSHQTFFRCVGLGAVDTVEQRVTADVQRLSDATAEIYSTLFKPLIDIVLFSQQVSKHGGWKGPSMIIVYYGMISVLIRNITPNFALLTTQQQQKDAQLKAGHSKILAYAEEIALTQAYKAELGYVNKLYSTLAIHERDVGFKRFRHNVVEGLMVKYGSVMVGYAICALSIFSPEASKLNSTELTGLYIHTSQLLLNLARAIGQFIMTYRSIASLAGYTHRVWQLESSIDTIVRNGTSTPGSPGSSKLFVSSPTASGVFEPPKPKGEVVLGDWIEFDKVPIVSPDNSILVEALSFFVKPGMNLLIVGPNGCGKSSTFRLLGELWPISGGRIQKPGYEHLYYVPQRPYMSSGTLRDQVIYPMNAKDMKVGDSALMECLRQSGLETLLDKPNFSWDAKLNWSGDALSQGEKQMIAMSRLYYHKPRFAILDECSSAIDETVEQQLYSQCKDMGITLITIAHRRSVWKYHSWVLRFDGNGGFCFSPLIIGAEGELVLTNVMYSHDAALIGKRIRVANDGVVTVSA